MGAEGTKYLKNASNKHNVCHICKDLSLRRDACTAELSAATIAVRGARRAAKVPGTLYRGAPVDSDRLKELVYAMELRQAALSKVESEMELHFMDDLTAREVIRQHLAVAITLEVNAKRIGKDAVAKAPCAPRTENTVMISHLDGGAVHSYFSQLVFEIFVLETSRETT